MFAGSQTDMCVGLDIHMEMVPMPAPVPTPFPMPFVGEVEYSAVGVLMGMGIGKAMSFFTGSPPTGPVVVNGFQCVKTGDEAKNKETLPHFVIPPGTAWTPLPKPLKLKISPPPPAPDNPAAPPGDAVFITGSKTVLFEQSSACRLGTLAMSCSDPVRLPSSVLLAVPKGLPVIVGGPDAIDWMAAAKAFFLRNKWTAGLLHQLVSLLPSERLRNLLAKGVCMLTGHPVDVATGRLLTWSEDFALEGPIRLPFERNYSSGWAARPSPLGYGWSHSYDERIWVERGCVVYLTADGRELEFHTHELPGRVMREGQEIFYPIDRLTLRCLGNGNWSVRSTDGLVRFFAIAEDGDRKTSQISRVTDRHGHAVNFRYRDGYLDRVETTEGRSIRFEHREGRLVRAMVPASQGDGWYDQMRFHYSIDGNLIGASDAANRSRIYAYDEHLLTCERDRDGVHFWFEYDGRDFAAKCIRTWGADETTDRLLFREITYDSLSSRTFVEDSLGNTTLYISNEANAVVAVVDPHGGRTEFGYDENLWKCREVDALGNTTCFTYDARGNEIGRQLPDGGMIHIVYRSGDQPVRLVDLLGCEWGWEYDARGRLVASWNSAGEMFRYEYEGTALRRVTRPDGRSYLYDYDRHENLRRVTFPDGTVQERWSDTQGRLVKIRDALGRVWRMVYDGQGRLVDLREPGNIWRTFEYSGEGDMKVYQDNLRHIELGYVGLHRVAWRKEGEDRIDYRYTTELELSCVENELDECYSFKYDACGRLVEETGFDGRKHTFLRDKGGQVISVIKPSNSQQHLTYDSLGRVTEIAYGDDTRETYAYDRAGNLLRATNREGEIAWTRDARGRALRESFDGGWVDISYDVLGNRTGTRTSRGLDERVEHTPMGHIARVTARRAEDGPTPPSWWSVSIVRDALGREVRRNLPGDVVTSWTRDESGLPRTLAIARGGDVLAHTEYTWAGDSQLRAAQSVGTDGVVYTHDARARLALAQWSSGTTQHRFPGPSGSLRKSADGQDRRYAAGGVLLETGGTQYAYSNDGELVEKKLPDGRSWTYTWNAEGTLASVRKPSGEEVRFRYDALKRRIAKASSSQLTRWQWDGDVPVHEVLESGGKVETTSWLFDGFAPIVKVAPDGRMLSVVTDYLGTPREMMDESGQIAWQAQLDIYGVPRDGSIAADDCPWRWPGQYADDELGLYYNRFRYYDPQRGDYIGQDPLRLRGGTSLYGYAEDPLVEIDAYGLTATTSCPAINTQKQAGHVPGTPQYNNRVNGGKMTSAFFSQAQADDVTREAWLKGTPDATGKLRLYEFGQPIGVGPGGGGFQTQVRVSLDSGGEIHGTPWGRVFAGPIK